MVKMGPKIKINEREVDVLETEEHDIIFEKLKHIIIILVFVLCMTLLIFIWKSL